MNTEATRRLQTSPIFQLSLASKELFHSNFLYWLWKAEADIFWSVMNYFGIKRDDKIIVRREWENFDLSLVRMGTRKKRGHDEETEYVADIIAVIENKVKSLPRKEQLKEYDEKIEKVDNDKSTLCTKILLSLPNPEFEMEGTGWKHVRYEDYVKVLNDNKDKASTTYHQAILTDYCQLLDTLCELKEEWLCGDDAAFLTMRYTSILKSDDDKEMRELRINDIRHKIIYSKIKELLCKRLNYPDSEECSESGFTNSAGLVSYRIKTTGTIKEYGIQIQGCQYRRFVIKKDKRILDDDCINKIIKSFPEECFDTTFKHSGTKKIGSYGDGFKYLYITISDEATIEEIINQIAYDIEHLIGQYQDVITSPKLNR
jgi:hypothetical protein